MTFVQVKVIDVLPRGGKAPIGDLLNGVGHLLEALGNLGKSVATIHQEFTRESDARRDQLHHQLEGVKWQQFSKIS